MNKVIPIMPCNNMKAQVAFYEALGFEIVELLTHPNPYAVVKYEDIEIQFYVSKNLLPNENPTMCYLKVDNVDLICKEFTDNLKTNTGKIPRTGFPRITKVRDLDADRRFTLSDVGGNTFYVGTIREKGEEDFFRILSSAKHAQKFTVLYDFVYSKEDYPLAQTFLNKILPICDELDDVDKAKLLLVKLEIQLGLNEPKDDSNLLRLLEQNKGNDKWQKIIDKYVETLQH